MIDLLVTFLILLGASIMFLGSVGLVRFPDVYSRIHALGVSGTLGIGCILLASFVFFCFVENKGSVKEIVVIVVLLLTSPVAVHLLPQYSQIALEFRHLMVLLDRHHLQLN